MIDLSKEAWWWGEEAQAEEESWYENGEEYDYLVEQFGEEVAAAMYIDELTIDLEEYEEGEEEDSVE